MVGKGRKMFRMNSVVGMTIERNKLDEENDDRLYFRSTRKQEEFTI